MVSTNLDSFARAMVSVAARGGAVAAEAYRTEHFLEEETVSKAEGASALLHEALEEFLSGSVEKTFKCALPYMQAGAR